MVSSAGAWKPPGQQSGIAHSGGSSGGESPPAWLQQHLSAAKAAPPWERQERIQSKAESKPLWRAPWSTTQPNWAQAYHFTNDDADEDADYLGEDVFCSVPDVNLIIPEVYRYHSDGVWDDLGWGCVYRNTQTILRAMGKPVPALPDLTKAMGNGDAWAHTPGLGCHWVEPHDVAEYLRLHIKDCPDMRLVTVATRDGATLNEVKTCVVGTQHVYEVKGREPSLK
eukprot:CAMPEP_0180439696 /NCGR_PEP_ID=MMETSP1036_2-20121128/12722_1 /TAXON_ID=632150 /ORGANISM="Azadinium spinosum, Strain 3D9" /LENGTH=224 /DNA_ID=CAMNT_0022445845 /DNA_START=1 /DNA_END=672 /DNA_ORIENTATION=-